jgi:hypothetical protein
MEGFTTLTINGHPFRADFGGFPMVVSLQFCFSYLKVHRPAKLDQPECGIIGKALKKTLIAIGL